MLHISYIYTEVSGNLKSGTEPKEEQKWRS